jgi:hydrogenase assembly chaperone HypC/HupF
MCLAVPFRIVSMERGRACCEVRGVRRDVSLLLLGNHQLTVGDHVLVRSGYAIQALTARDADATWDLFDQIIAVLDSVEV